MFLYSVVSSPLDRSKRFTLILPWQTCSFRHQLGFSWKHSSHAAIAQRLLIHMSTTVYSQVLIYTAESTEAPWSERKCPNFETVAKGIRTRALLLASPAFYHWAIALHTIMLLFCFDGSLSSCFNGDFTALEVFSIVLYLLSLKHKPSVIFKMSHHFSLSLWNDDIFPWEEYNLW